MTKNSVVRTIENPSTHTIHLVLDYDEADVIACEKQPVENLEEIRERTYQKVTCIACIRQRTEWLESLKKLGEVMRAPRIGE